MAEIIQPEQPVRAAGPGVSYWLSTKVLNQPLAMEAGLAARLQSAIKERAFDSQLHVNGPMASKFLGTRAGQSGYRVTDDGIAILAVSGVLIDRGEFLGDLGGFATSYEGLAEQVRRVLKDDAIKTVVLDIDSGGGMAAGLFDLCDRLIGMRRKKKIYAVAANMAASAAYAIAACADEFYVTKLGVAGSIGVITLHMSYADMLAQSGIEPTIIHAGAHKPNGNPYQALSHLARAEMAASCDQIYADFVAHVARERGLEPDAVRATEARVYYGDQAVATKLADGVKSFEDVLEHIRTKASKGGRPRGSKTTTATAKGDPAMPGTDSGQRPDYDAVIAAALSSLARSLPAAAAPAAPILPQPPTQEAQAPAKAVPAAQDPTARIKAILGCEAAKQRQSLAHHLALETDLDAATAEAILANAPAEAKARDPADGGLGNALERQMAKPQNAGGIKPEAAAGSATAEDRFVRFVAKQNQRKAS